MVKEWESMDTQEFENNHKKEKLEQKYNEMEREIPRHIYIQKVKEINEKYKKQKEEFQITNKEMDAISQRRRYFEA
jgi:hypothetical protein